MWAEARHIFLAAEYSACSIARAHVTDFGARHGIDVDDAVLCASEILANAIRADEETPNRIGLVELTIRALPGVLFVSVRDWGQGVPMMRIPGTAGDPGRLPESGRGLALVDATSAKWGVAGNRTGGKTVWCQLPLTSTAALPARRDAPVPSHFSTEHAVLERVLRRMRALWPDPSRPAVPRRAGGARRAASEARKSPCAP